MNSKKLVDWLEIVAAFSVLAGLLLLVQEIRLNTRAIAHEASINRFAVLTEPFFESAEMRAADQKIRDIDGPNALEAALIEKYKMTPAEALVWSRHLTQLWNVVQADYDHGDRELAKYATRGLLRTVDNQIFVQHWTFRGDFAAFVQETLNEENELRR